MKEVHSLQEFKSELNNNAKIGLLIYKKGNSLNDSALESLVEAEKDIKNVSFFSANAFEASDIHPHYQITSAPSLLIFEKESLKDVIKGHHQPSYYKSLFSGTSFTSQSSEGSTQKSVTVYSTPTCSWCNTLKQFLRKHNIQFRDIDVSRDQAAGERMVATTGQRGVPQSNIGGTWVVGFDQNKIKSLLNI